jgi:hypothetical protein
LRVSGSANDNFVEITKKRVTKWVVIEVNKQVYLMMTASQEQEMISSGAKQE